MAAKNSLIADSGFWIALFNQQGPYHRRAVAALDTFLDRLLAITWPVVVETGHLLFQRAGFQVQLDFVQTIQRGGADIFNLDSIGHLPRMIQLLQKYRDLPMDLTDASLVILAEQLGHGRILSTDQRDFATYHWKNEHPFENLLVP